MISTTNELFLQVVKRAENNDLTVLKDTFVDTGSLVALLKSPSNQVIYGRRGTGKTHALLYTKAKAAEGDLAIFKDLRSIGSNSSIYGDESKPLSDRATLLLLDVLRAIHDDLVSYALEKSKETDVLRLLDILHDEIAKVCVVGDVEIERQDSARSTKSSTDSAGANIGVQEFSFTLSNARNSANEVGSNDKYILRGKSAPHVRFGTITKLLTNIIERASINRIWILLDEWSVVPADLQPFLADLLRRSLFPVQKIIVKIAAIEQRSQFKITLKNGDYLGFELGADISADIDLDDFMVFNSDKDRARKFMSYLIFNHIRIASGGKLSEGVDMDRSVKLFITSAFSQEAAFDELVRAAEGVPRDAMNILGICAQRAQENKIGIPIIRDAAKSWYQRDKENTIPTSAKTLIIYIQERVIKQKRARAFLLERNSSNNPLIESLNDLRILHILKRGISAKDMPGRFNAYSLDYGCYVDLLATKESAPDCLFRVDDNIPVDVPGEDYRSIRHAVLDLSEYEKDN